jgi:3-hydroxyisobutyrate dehydrogenase
MILGISMIGVAEAFVLAERLELDFFKLFQVASTSSGQCWSLTSYCPVPGPVPNSPANRDYAAGFAAALMLKDLTLAQEAAASVNAPTALGAHAARIYESIAAGHGDKDFSFVFRYLAERMRGDVP